MEPFRVDDWSGGITDNYLNGAKNRAQRLDNFLISRNRKPVERPGSTIDNVEDFRIPAGQQRISKIWTAANIVMKQSARNVAYSDGSGYHTIVGPTGNPVFGAGTTGNFSSVAEWQKHWLLTIDEFSTPRVMYQDASAVWQTRTLGLPEMTAPTPTLTVGGATVSYIYGICYKVTFTRGTLTQIWRGPITQFTAASAAATAIGGGSPCVISSIPVLANGGTENYDTTNVVKEIYRTTTGGTELRLVASISNATTSYNDVTADGALTGIRAYTTGDVYDNDPPPPAKFVEVVNGIAWWGAVKEGSEVRLNRIRQSLVNQPYSAPGGLTVDLDGDLTGLSSVDVYLLAFERNRLWRIEGAVDSLGQGVVRKRIVSKTIGTISNDSIVKSKKGVYFAAEDGFYFTDGFEVMKLSEHLNESYRRLLQNATQERRINGAEDPITKRVYWAAMSDTSVADCDMMYVLDPHFGLSEESSFTTLSGGPDADDWFATSMLFVGEKLYRADNRGHVFYHSDDLYEDMVIDTTVDADEWTTRAVRYDYISAAWAFGDEVNKKYGPYMNVVAKNETNVSMLIQSINNDAGISAAKNLKEVRFRNNFVWGDDDIIWGDDSIVWNYQGTIVAERYFPSGSLRFLYKQIRMTNAETVIARSDDDGLATMDPGGPTALLLDGDRTWPPDIVGFNLYTAADSYGTAYPIAERTDDTLTVEDDAGSFPAGDYAWLVKGYRRGERLKLESYTITFQQHGESTTGYQKGEDGSNA